MMAELTYISQKFVRKHYMAKKQKSREVGCNRASYRACKLTLSLQEGRGYR
jgi:hypothetical protein